MPEISAAANPQLTNSLIAQALADDPVPSASVSAVLPDIDDEPDLSVELPAGHVDIHGTVHRTAVVRELTGLDEEAIAKVATSPAKYLAAILSRGVEKLGELPATPHLLDSLLIGDRDALLVGISRATYGNDIEFTVVCPGCKEERDMTVHLDVDVKSETMPDPSERTFQVDLRRGRKAVVTMPTGHTQKAISETAGRTQAEINTEILSRCVVAFLNKDGEESPVLGASQVQALPILDRENILKKLQERRVGPQLGEVALACGNCEEQIELPLTLADLFRF